MRAWFRLLVLLPLALAKRFPLLKILILPPIYLFSAGLALLSNTISFFSGLSKKTWFTWLGILLAIIFVITLWAIPQLQSDRFRHSISAETVQNATPQEKIQLEKNAADIENATRLTLAQIFGGMVLLGGLYFTYRNVKTAQDTLRVTEEGKITDRFSKAVELLGGESLELRLGGIYALERIARDSPKDYWTVIEVLTAFVRENSHNEPETVLGRKTTSRQNISSDGPSSEPEEVRPDVQTIMTVLLRRKRIKENENLDLQGANLKGCNLTHGDLSGCNLRGADLSYADLSGTRLNGSDFRNASLAWANLSGLDLKGVRFEQANLSEANLSHTTFAFTHFERADLRGANLSRTVWGDTHFEDANFTGANLRETLFGDNVYIIPEQIVSGENPEKAILVSALKDALAKWKQERGLLETR